MKEPARQAIVARPLFAKTVRIPKGKMSIDYDKIGEMGEAEISYEYANDGSEDMITATEATIRMAVIQKKYKIPKGVMDAYASEGKPIGTAAMMSAMHVVATKEDTLLIQGWKPDGSAYKIKGLYQGATNTTPGADFGTYGNAIISVTNALSEMTVDKINGVNFNLVLNPVQYAQLSASAAVGYVDEWDRVMKLLNKKPNGYPGMILESNDIVAGTGMVSAVDPTGNLFDLAIMQDMSNDLGIDSKSPNTSDTYGKVYEVVVPRIVNGDAITTLTAI
jgi:uncharacterized linocin/CFP29 family protein